MTASTLIPDSCVVFTPRVLADAMVRAIGRHPGSTWLEPSVGGGVFLEALRDIGIPSSQIRAIDAAPSPQPNDQLARTLRSTEFLNWAIASPERFTAIIGNPPFLALARASEDVQAAAAKIAAPRIGAVPASANCWYAFVCASLPLLKAGGALCYVLPAAWDYADYASPLRSAIAHLFEKVQVFRSARPMFEGVQDGSVVLLCHGYHPSGRGRLAAIRRHECDSLSSLVEALRLAAQTSGAVAGPAVGTEAFDASLLPSAAQSSPRYLSDIVDIRLGGVTGDASYFLLNEEDRVRLSLPTAVLRPVVSRARHLVGSSIGRATWESFRARGDRVWLFRPSENQASLGSVSRYLALERGRGGCDRHALKVRSRQPWYRTPLPRAIDGFMSGMSTWGPWIVFRAMPRLVATNTLYTVRFRHRWSNDQQAAWCLWLLTSVADEQLRTKARRYADGLVKYEPGDLAELELQQPIRVTGASAAYSKAINDLLSGNRAVAQREADSWF